MKRNPWKRKSIGIIFKVQIKNEKFSSAIFNKNLQTVWVRLLGSLVYTSSTFPWFFKGFENVIRNVISNKPPVKCY